MGAGYMGGLRARSAHLHEACSVSLVADSDKERAKKLAREVGARAVVDWGEVANSDDVDAIVVATPHQFLATIAAAALHAQKHVFCEKPMARSATEAEEVLRAAGYPLVSLDGPHDPRVPVACVGYTLRHHPAVQLGWKWMKEGRIGEPMYVRGRYGHGGRPGYEREWRMDPEIGGGGELLDQGVHLIDLSRAFLGDFIAGVGLTESFFWKPPGKNVEDNAFLFLQTSEGKVASLHASWTQWKNLFSFEAFGREGSIAIEGLGGSYGPEHLIFVRRKEGKLPQLEEVTFSAGGSSAGVWKDEWDSFVATARPDNSDAATNTLRSATLGDGYRALQIVDQIYAAGGRRQEGLHPLSEPLVPLATIPK